MHRVNIGCGTTPTPGWRNYDNSFSVRLARHRAVAGLLGGLGLLGEDQRNFIAYARGSEIRWADVRRGIPEADASAEVVYSCHMIEHLDRHEALGFLKEARRILAPGGILRVAAPDLRYHVDRYLQDGDADEFVEGILLARRPARTRRERLKRWLVGDRDHLWMYDGASLCRLLADVGFADPQVLEPGKTSIRDPGGLDLAERSRESVFVEALRP